MYSFKNSKYRLVKKRNIGNNHKTAHRGEHATHNTIMVTDRLRVTNYIIIIIMIIIIDDIIFRLVGGDRAAGWTKKINVMSY